MGKKIDWTEEQKEWIRQNGKKYYDLELTRKFNLFFGTNHPRTTIGALRKRLGISKDKYVYDGEFFYSTPEQKQWTIDNINKFVTRKEFVDAFNEHFNLNLPVYTIVYIYTNLGLKINNGRIYYTEEENNWIRENYKFYKNDELCKLFEEKFKKRISKSQLKNKKGNMRLSYLKANNINSHNQLPVGTITKVVDKVVIKWKNEGKPSDWKSVGRYFYEKYYGPIPKDHCVYHLDGDQMNYSKENLILVSKKEGGQLYAMCMNERYNFFGQGKITEAIFEVIKTENLINELQEENK